MDNNTSTIKNKKTIWYIIISLFLLGCLAGIVIAICLNKSTEKEYSAPVDKAVVLNVSNALSNVFDSDDSLDVKYEKATERLDALEKRGWISNVTYSEKYSAFGFEYISGGLGCLALEKSYSDTEWSMNIPVSEENIILPMNNSEGTPDVVAADSKWLFLFYANATEDERNYNYIAEQCNEYRNAGVSVDLILDYEVEDFTQLQGYDLIYIMGHGGFYRNDDTPHILTNEIITQENIEEYSNIPDGDIVTISFGEENSYYMIASSFFENHYDVNDLNNAVVLHSCCGLFGVDNVQNNEFGQSYINAGAGTVIGFVNSVQNTYANTFYDRVLFNLLTGQTIGEAFENACDDLGADEIEFEQISNSGVSSEGKPVLFGQKYVKIKKESTDIPDTYGKYIITIKDAITQQPIEDAFAMVAKGTFQDYNNFRFYTSNNDGAICVTVPEGGYACEIQHNYYETELITFDVEDGVTSILLDDLLMKRKNGMLTLSVKDFTSGLSVSGVRVDVISNDTDNFDVVASAVSDANGNVTMNLEYGSYSLAFTHADYEYFGCSVSVECENVVLIEPICLNRKENGDDLDRILGTYTGSYFESQGETGLTLTVYKDDGWYKAIFDFYNLPGRNNAKSGKYYMDVFYNMDTGEYEFVATDWIERPSSYYLVDLKGKLVGDVLSGESPTVFSLTRMTTNNYPSQYVGKTFKELKAALGSDYTYSSVGNGVFDVKFKGVPFSFEFYSGDFFMTTLPSDTFLDDVVLDRIKVETKNTITLVPNATYTNLENYDSIYGKTADIEFYEDGLYGTMLYVTVDDVTLLYVWQFTTEDAIAEYVYVYRSTVEPDGKLSLEDMPIIAHDAYPDNEGDSTIFNLGGDGLTQCDDGETFNRYGNVGVDGSVYTEGFEVWIARWNYRDEISWASATFDLGGRYQTLVGKTNLIPSYNTTNFDTTIYFYNGDKLLASYRLTDADYITNISVDVSGVNELRLFVQDNVAVSGGTSFALYDMFLDASAPEIPSDAFEYNGHHYKIYSNVCNTWEEAKSYCEGLGGHLAVISSQEENDALFGYLIESGYTTAYFGLYQDQSDEWVWVTSDTGNYLNWHADEPSHDTNEKYAEFYWKFTDGTWNDGNFGSGTQSDTRNFICEWE